MARLSRPTWTPADVLALPATTEVRYRVVPGASAAKGIEVAYEFTSKAARFEQPPPGELLTAEEKKSDPPQPALVPVSRTDTRIVDRYPGAKTGAVLAITRVLRLDKLVSGQHGFSSLEIKVCDVTQDDQLIDCNRDLASIIV